MVKFKSKSEGWDELERIKVCRRAITKLLIPEKTLDEDDQDEMSILFGYFDEQEERAMNALLPMLGIAG